MKRCSPPAKRDGCEVTGKLLAPCAAQCCSTAQDPCKGQRKAERKEGQVKVRLRAPNEDVGSMQTSRPFQHDGLCTFFRLPYPLDECWEGEDERWCVVQGIGSRSGSTFAGVLGAVGRLGRWVWPKGEAGLQLRILGCVGLFVAGRVVNVLVPLYAGWIVDALGRREFCWGLVLAYAGLRFAQGGASNLGGAINTARTFLWVRVAQWTARTLQTTLYRHLHDLSLRWHLSRKTGEVLRVVDRGQTAVASLLQYVLFRIAPAVVDVLIAIAYFFAGFNAWFGLIVGLTMLLYLALTYWMTEWRTKFRREMNLRSNATQTKGVDSLLNFEMVKYFGAEGWEVERYEEALLGFQDYEWLAEASVALLNMVQILIVGAGLLGGSLLCAWMVAGDGLGVVVGHVTLFAGRLSVGDYVLFAAYIMQLYQPLTCLGVYYRMIQQSFVDMENMLDLLEEEQEVADAADAADLRLSKGRIEVDKVSFAYSPERPILRDVSFVVEPGTTTALVGQTGSGKSTLVRLLFRFYDVTQGRVLVDGQDIAHLKQASLRSHIGVVPQDTVLFNDSIRYNIAYGRRDATEAEVEEAAAAAEVHERILSFPEGYETKVGERGLKLSGGEKQRVALARTLLKGPAVVLLDEATSALDTRTERAVQAALRRVCEGRTTVVVAHRLSTIAHAEQILLLHDGRVEERGTHQQLIALGGRFADMWEAQLRAPEGEGPAAKEPAAQPTDPFPTSTCGNECPKC